MPRDEHGKNKKYKVNREKEEATETAEDWERVEENIKNPPK